MAKDIPFCPLMTAGCEIDKVCTLDRCAWYISSIKKCAIYLLGHNALVDITQKQKVYNK
ncbi:MAG: hypothetical protein IJU04_02260 [Ruminococcus sp.]|nr:hypothetical protein [Ruminococcus sp.]